MAGAISRPRRPAEKTSQTSRDSDRPLNLVDIGRALGESAHVQRLGDVPIRAWRDDLTLIRDSLSYARTVLAADLAILTQTASPETSEWQDVIDGLPGVLDGRPRERRVAGSQ